VRISTDTKTASAHSQTQIERESIDAEAHSHVHQASFRQELECSRSLSVRLQMSRRYRARTKGPCHQIGMVVLRYQAPPVLGCRSARPQSSSNRIILIHLNARILSRSTDSCPRRPEPNGRAATGQERGSAILVQGVCNILSHAIRQSSFDRCRQYRPIVARYGIMTNILLRILETKPRRKSSFSAPNRLRHIENGF
jgi:hypothetical protein